MRSDAGIFKEDAMAETIAAVATGNVLSAIGIIRMSGDDAIEIASRVFRSVSGVELENAKNRKLYYGYMLDSSGRDIDLCLCTVSRAPNSYTGENTVEFQCHGSPTVLSEGLASLFAAGARQAEAGEFTKRAFINGRMDLTQAEAVVDLIEAETGAAAQNAVGQLSKAISVKTDAVYDELIDMLAHFNVALDYPDEVSETFELEKYRDMMISTRGELIKLLETYGRGRLLKEGVRCAVIGKPNVGKSSLLNALLGYDRAIVTDIAGTTRDTIEEKIKLGDVVLRLSDTAGIRETDDPVELLGVDRAVKAADNSELVIAVFDGAGDFDGDDREILKKAVNAKSSVAVINKSDLPKKLQVNEIEASGIKCYYISAKTGEGITKLCADIEAAYKNNVSGNAGEIITNARQADAIRRAADSLGDAVDAVDAGMTADCVMTAVEQALNSIGEISGKTVKEDMISRIFERFCVGK